MKKSIIVLSLVLSSCLGTKLVKETNSVSKIGEKQISLSNTRWEIDDDLKTNTHPYIIFDPKEGITGNAGCNKIFSTNVAVISSNGHFSIKNISSTRMLCPNMDMNNEKNFINILQSADKYVVTGSLLELYKGNLLLIKFRRVD